MVAPNLLNQGESRGSALQTDNKKENLKRRFVEEENVPPDLDQPWKMCGMRTNYCYLNDPFPDEEEADTINDKFTSAEQIFAAFANTSFGGEEPKSLEEVKQSPEWIRT
jgi:hypothetical protein